MWICITLSAQPSLRVLGTHALPFLCPCLHAGRDTPHDALSHSSTHADNLDKDGILLLQQSIDMGERNRIKWLTLPDPLARYVCVEGDHHKDRKVTTSHHNGLSCRGGSGFSAVSNARVRLVYYLHMLMCVRGYGYMDAYKRSTRACVQCCRYTNPSGSAAVGGRNLSGQ